MLDALDRETGEVMMPEDAAVISMELASREKVIERGLTTFVEVGQALMEIRDQRLYCQTHSTFEEYCRERWGMTHRRANHLIAAYSVVENVGTIVPTAPANEAQARPLASFDPDTQRAIWQAAVETAPNGNLTAAHVEATVNEMTGRQSPATRPATSSTPTFIEGYMQAISRDPQFLDPNTPEEEAVPKSRDPLMTSDSYEWYTPEHIIERARRALGFIALDPCSSEEANKIVQAERFYSIADNGLSRSWGFQTIYMNPPYGADIGRWVERLVQTYTEHYQQRGIKAIALLPARTDTQWFQLLRAFPRCFLYGRLKFWGPEETGNSATFPSVVIALGCDLETFSDAFSDIGDIYVRYERDSS